MSKLSRPRLIETQEFGGCQYRDPSRLGKSCRDRDFFESLAIHCIVTTVESTLDSSIENSLPQIDGAMNSPTNSFPVNSAPLPQCDTCHAIFESVEDFKEHDTAQFCCDDCGICYRTQEAADLHTLELHPDTHYARTYIPLSTKVLFANSQTRKP